MGTYLCVINNNCVDNILNNLLESFKRNNWKQFYEWISIEKILNKNNSPISPSVVPLIFGQDNGVLVLGVKNFEWAGFLISEYDNLTRSMILLEIWNQR